MGGDPQADIRPPIYRLGFLTALYVRCGYAEKGQTAR